MAQNTPREPAAIGEPTSYERVLEILPNLERFVAEGQRTSREDMAKCGHSEWYTLATTEGWEVVSREPYDGESSVTIAFESSGGVWIPCRILLDHETRTARLDPRGSFVHSLILRGLFDAQEAGVKLGKAEVAAFKALAAAHEGAKAS